MQVEEQVGAEEVDEGLVEVEEDLVEVEVWVVVEGWLELEE